MEPAVSGVGEKSKVERKTKQQSEGSISKAARTIEQPNENEGKRRRMIEKTTTKGRRVRSACVVDKVGKASKSETKCRRCNAVAMRWIRDFCGDNASKSCEKSIAK